jgi:hypothetical protein
MLQPCMAEHITFVSFGIKLEADEICALFLNQVN